MHPGESGDTTRVNSESSIAESGARRSWRALPAAHRAALAATLLLVLFFAVRGAGLSLREQGNDFTVYYDAGRAALEGRDPLSVRYFIYLPVYAVAMAPLSLLPYGAAAVLWAAIGLVALVACAKLCIELLLPEGRGVGDGPPSSGWAWLWWAPAACVARPIDSNFANGQVNLIVLWLVLLGLRAVRRGNERGAGLWLGAATALKLVPGLFLAYLLARRSWRAAAWGALAVVALAFLAPVPLLGWNGNLRAMGHWWSTIAGPYARGGEELLEARGHLPGQSLTAVAYRLLSDSPASSARPEERANVASLDPDIVRALVRAAAALLLLAVLVPVAAWPRARGTPEQVREAALVASTALLIGPLVHKAHMVWLILPFAAALHAAFVERSRGAIAALAIAVLLVSGTAPALVGRGAATSFLTYNVVFWGALALHAWLLASVWQSTESGQLLHDSRASEG